MTSRLRYRVDIYSETSADGAEVPSYTKSYSKVPCDIVQVSGGETYRGRQIEATATHLISFRQLESIVPTMKFIDTNSITYHIVRITKRSGRDYMLDCQCVEVVE